MLGRKIGKEKYLIMVKRYLLQHALQAYISSPGKFY